VTAQGCAGAISYVWDFGDGSPHGTIRTPTHTYTSAGTFHWVVTASADGRTTSQAGSIVVSPASAPAPTVIAVRQQANPLRIRIDGTNFVNGLSVYVGADTVPWPSVQFVSARRILLNGTGLAAKFPTGVTTSIRIVNPDGQWTSTSFTRR
jgi:PKD repeat protein